MYSWNDNTTKINEYDTITRHYRQISINISMPELADGIRFNDDLYIIGGKGTSSTYEVNI